ncbi:hypothetical protein [Mucilaginibacter sp. UYCu711]|uniref:hypothetical protein n=1 Tax=Mucilaginibacter sp. UYCu711 TaxID=3156339 RepID=UPI003D1C4C06
MKNIKIPAKHLVILILLSSFIGNVYAQRPKSEVFADDLANKLNLYGEKMQAPVLFIHFDKNVYTNNENVWFTAYFLNLINQTAYKTLCVALVRDNDHLLVINEKFIVSQGLSFGNTVIPDTTAAGHYRFIAYSNCLLNGKPDVLFAQKIIIKRDAQPSFSASLNPLDTSLTNVRQKVMLLVTSNDHKKPISTLSLDYYLGDASRPVMKGEAKITPTGQYIFDIPSSQLRQGENRLHVRVGKIDETKDLNIDLPARPQPAILKFFPEGGNFVTGLKNVVAWEVKNHTGQGLAAEAILYEDKNIINTIHTNSYGFGRFILTPKDNTVYSIKLVSVNKKDTLYNLPASINHIPVLSIQTAVANSVLTVKLKTDKPQLVYLNLHNYTQLFSSSPVKLGVDEKKFSILLNDIPKGLTQITLTDSLGRPLSERLFFAHYDEKPGLQINTDKISYKSREKVTVSLKLDGVGPLDNGLVSIACVQQNRLQINNKNDIETYFYLKNQLGDLPVKENYWGSDEADKSFLEDILLIKGWRRYSWLDMLKVKPTEITETQGKIFFKGQVTKYGAKISVPVDVINYNFPLHVIKTDSTGNFTVADNDLIVQRNKKVVVFINNDKKELYQVKINDPYPLTTKNILKEMEFADRNLPQQQSTNFNEISGFDRAIKLKEVKIKADNNSFHRFGAPSANVSEDYVCRYNILNCPTHRNEPDNRPPVIGESYYINGIYTVYRGQNAESEHRDLAFSGIYAEQEFYPSDLSQPNSPPEYMSTIYWKYLAKVTSSNTVEFSFYTNEISGSFKIVVQGRTKSDMIYGERSFEVTKE